MVKCLHGRKEIEELCLHQLKSFFINIDEELILETIPASIKLMEENFSEINNSSLNDGIDIIFNPYHSTTWAIFLYRLSHELSSCCEKKIIEKAKICADQVYYLNKIMHGIDWYHPIELPIHFMCEHPVGSVLGRASYGDYLMIYQGTTIGGNRENGYLFYPKIGNRVTMYANATVLGKSDIGNNVIISANSYLINEKVPDNSIVFGSSPNIVIKEKTEEEIRSMTSHIWR